jgi:nucleoside-diphosphate-sugar epimerase
MTKVLIYGGNSDLRSYLCKRFLNDRHFEVYGVEFEMNIYPINYKEYFDVLRIPDYSYAQRSIILSAYLESLTLSTFDYIINCHFQPLPNLPNSEVANIVYNELDTAILASKCSSNGFTGSFINVSSFHVYGSAPTGIPLEVKPSRFSVAPIDDDSLEEIEERFGYSDVYGISEVMLNAPKTMSTYQHSLSMREEILNAQSKGNFHLMHLRLPYLVHYNIDDKYINYSDDINRLLRSLSKGEELVTSMDNKQNCVYDFLTPDYVADFIFDLVNNNDILIGDYNIGSRLEDGFSEVELLQKIKASGYDKVSFQDTVDRIALPMPYYVADCRKLEDDLEDHVTSLNDFGGAIQIISEYLDKVKK